MHTRFLLIRPYQKFSTPVKKRSAPSQKPPQRLYFVHFVLGRGSVPQSNISLFPLLTCFSLIFVSIEGIMRHFLVLFVVCLYVKRRYVFVEAFCQRAARLERSFFTPLMSVDSALLGPRALDLEYSNGIRLVTGVYSFSWTSPDVPSSSSPTRPKAQIDLYSMLHVGDQSYYDEISSRMSSYDVVLYELITDTKNCILSEGKDYKRQLTKEIYSKVNHPPPTQHPFLVLTKHQPSDLFLLRHQGHEQSGFQVWSRHPS